MKRSVIPAVAVCLSALFVSHPDTHAQNNALPGARPIVLAQHYGSLQAAIDALGPEGGVVYLPPGEFRIGVPLIIETGDVRLEGSGTATHIVNTNKDGRPAIHLRSGKEIGSGSRRGQHEPLWRVMLSNFRVTGNDDSGHGIHAQNINEIFIQGVTVSEHGRDGIVLDYCYEDPRINDCLITYNRDAGVRLLGCHDIVISGNQFEENNDALRCEDGFNLCMTGNNLDDHLRHGVVIENTYGSVLSGNMIEECQGKAVVLDRDCYGTTLSANVIAHEFSGGIDLVDAHGCSVSANTFTIVKGYAVEVGPGSGRITIAANNFSDSYIGEGKTRREGGSSREENTNEAGGILLDGTSDIAITGNVFSGLTTGAITRTDRESERVVVSGNVGVE
ncbi:MAG: right-handed parallel beta-helix repeat-containing protein [Planctomycetota bacterium]|jgi:parallel beta-helix repeat protein